MEKFTKGEWVKDFNGTKGHIKAVKKERDHFSKLKTPTIARYDVITPSISDDEKEANAHLIACAPEMYKFLDDLANGRGTDYPIEKLLAKARGEECNS